MSSSSFAGRVSRWRALGLPQEPQPLQVSSILRLTTVMFFCRAFNIYWNRAKACGDHVIEEYSIEHTVNFRNNIDLFCLIRSTSRKQVVKTKLTKRIFKICMLQSNKENIGINIKSCNTFTNLNR